MNRESQSRNYHSLWMGKRDNQIHDLLSPIITTVRNNKINSFLQLKSKVQADQPEPSFIFHPYAITSTNKKAKMNQTFHSKTPRSRQNPEEAPQTAENIMRATHTHGKDKKKPPTSHSEKKKLFRINSKIKKHLVESIDFDEIEKMLYKKRDCVTQYEHYLQTKQQERSKRSQDHSPRKTSVPRNRKQDNVGMSPQDSIKPPQEFFYQTLPARGLNKKRLWPKEQHRKNKSSLISPSLLDPVEGHCFSTIQN